MKIENSLLNLGYDTEEKSDNIECEHEVEENDIFYLAYGSNMNVEQMKKRCPNALLVERTYIKDYQLEFNKHATIEPLKGSKVPALLWKLQPSDVDELDRYEGVASGYYYKSYVNITINNKRVQALVYIMAVVGIESKGLRTYPQDFYYDLIHEGYRAAEFDYSFLEEARKRTDQNME
jgi:gamma-glutamylcyclotransferase (GGCT)/AIG2-like uncharacterized protein YtfP